MSLPSEELIRRAAIVCGLRAGRSDKEIADFFSFPATTVYKLKRQFDAHICGGGTADDFDIFRKMHKRRSNSTPDSIKKIRLSARKNPGMSMRAIARKSDVSEITVRRILKEDGFKSYVLRKGQLLTPAMKERRVERARKLLLRLKKPKEAGQLIFFSDEKNFTQDQKVNRRNNRWLCKNVADVPVVMSTKSPRP